MKLHQFAPMLLIAALILLASCSGQTQLPSAPATAVGSLEPSVVVSAASSLPTTPEESESPTAEPTPTIWEMATPGPVPTERAKDAPLTKDDYFIIDKNWVNVIGDWNNDFFIDELEGYRYGVIDIHGNIIVPFTSFNIDPIVLSPVKNEPGNEKLFFFALDFISVNGKAIRDSGYLYLPNGSKASPDRYNWLDTYQKNRIVAERTDTGLCGIMDANMNQIVQFKYLDMVVFADWIAATKKKADGSYWIDFFDKKCKVVKSLHVGSDNIEYLDQDLLMAKGQNGKWGFIDKSFTWCAEPKWDGIDIESSWDEDFGPGYAMTRNGRRYNVNKYGKQFIPDGYKPEDCYMLWPINTYQDHYVYMCESTDEIGNRTKGVVFDDTGRILYVPAQNDYGLSLYENGILEDGSVLYDLKSKQVIYHNKYPGSALDVADGIFVDDGCAYDLTGKRLYSTIKDILSIDLKNKVILCDDGNTVYTMDGKKLPLPTCERIECISPERFIVHLQNGLTGICNEEGKWITAPNGYYTDFSSWLCWPVFTFPQDNTSGQCGVYSLDGQIIYDAIFTYIEPIRDRYYEVYYQGIHGVIDDKGNWIWHHDILNTIEG